MKQQMLKQFRHFIAGHRDNLETWLESESKHNNIPLGGASLEEVVQVVSLHNDALDRIDSGEFGKCEQCGGEIEPERLELDFTTRVCLEHYSEDQKRMLERDLELAAKVQRQLLPHQVPVLPGVQAAAYTGPAQVVGGDYFDFFSYPDGAQGLAIGDVMGKGLSASMLMSGITPTNRLP
jgi:RNA polymerase-binding transcription factor DksA